MLALIGWLALIIPLLWVSIFVVFTTVPTWSDALFSMRWYHKILGACMWILTIAAWIWWLSAITVNV